MSYSQCVFSISHHKSINAYDLIIIKTIPVKFSNIIGIINNYYVDKCTKKYKRTLKIVMNYNSFQISNITIVSKQFM